eukprot:7497286-Pyramimonas_sp.AAC.1
MNDGEILWGEETSDALPRCMQMPSSAAQPARRAPPRLMNLFVLASKIWLMVSSAALDVCISFANAQPWR